MFYSLISLINTFSHSLYPSILYRNESQSTQLRFICVNSKFLQINFDPQLEMFHEETLEEAQDESNSDLFVWLIIFRKMFQRSVSTFSRMFCSHVGVSDHSATLSVPRCQAIDLYGRLDRPPMHHYQVQVQKLPFSLSSLFLSFSRRSRYIRERSRNKSDRKKATVYREKAPAVTCDS